VDIGFRGGQSSLEWGIASNEEIYTHKKQGDFHRQKGESLQQIKREDLQPTAPGRVCGCASYVSPDDQAHRANLLPVSEK
jgi:hypothetical protein